jgi:ABC-2 type transport system permease protein
MLTIHILTKLTWVDLKLYLRSWIASFFTLVFPLLMLFLFGAMYGNDPSPLFGGFGSMDITVPGYIAALIIGANGFMSLPLELAARRQQGVLRRMRATPLHPGAVISSQLLVNLLMSFGGAVLLVVAGVLVYHIHTPVQVLPIILGFLISCASLFSIGLLIASLVPNINAARAVCFILFYPMMFLSGGTMPIQFLPETIQKASAFIPLSYAVRLLKGLWLNNTWDMTAVWVLCAILLVCFGLSIWLFRWE